MKLSQASGVTGRGEYRMRGGTGLVEQGKGALVFPKRRG